MYQISIFPMFSLVFLMPVMIWKREHMVKKGMVKFFLLFGIFNYFGVIGQFAPILLGVSVAVTVFLLYTQPLWTTLFGRIFFKEKVNRKKIAAMALVIIGSWFIADPMGITKTELIGVVIALLGGIFLSAWVIFGRHAGIKEYSPIATKFGSSFTVVIFLLLTYPIIAFFIPDQSMIGLGYDIPITLWFYLLMFGAFAQILSNILYFKGAKKIHASTSGVILMLEPVSAMVLAAVFLSQMPTISMIFGAVLVLLANYIVMK